MSYTLLKHRRFTIIVSTTTLGRAFQLRITAIKNSSSHMARYHLKMLVCHYYLSMWLVTTTKSCKNTKWLYPPEVEWKGPSANIMGVELHVPQMKIKWRGWKVKWMNPQILFTPKLGNVSEAAWTINEPHLPYKTGLDARAPTAQDVFQPIPGLISCTGVAVK